MTEADIKNHLKRLVTLRGSQRAVARHLGVSQPYINDILRGKRSATGDKLLKKLGFKKTVNYEVI